MPVIAGDGLGDGIDVGRRFTRHDYAIDDRVDREEVGSGCARFTRIAPARFPLQTRRTGFLIVAHADGRITQCRVFHLGDDLFNQIHADGDFTLHRHGEFAPWNAAQLALQVENAGLADGRTGGAVHHQLRVLQNAAVLEQGIAKALEPVQAGGLDFVQFGALQHIAGAEQVLIVILGGVEAVVIPIDHGAGLRGSGQIQRIAARWANG